MSAARDLGECITLQLRVLDADTPGLATALALAHGHLDKIASRELALLRRELKVSDAAGARLPSTAWRADQFRRGQYVVPDVFVRRSTGGWTVEMNSATVPRVRLNESYANLIGRAASHATMRTQLQEARCCSRAWKSGTTRC